MRRDYGSRLPELIDAPTNQETAVEMIAATAEALEQWEPRFQLESVKVTSAAPGGVELKLTGLYLLDGSEVTLDGIVVSS